MCIMQITEAIVYFIIRNPETLIVYMVWIEMWKKTNMRYDLCAVEAKNNGFIHSRESICCFADWIYAIVIAMCAVCHRKNYTLFNFFSHLVTGTTTS
jgi:hypothetical protein